MARCLKPTVELDGMVLDLLSNGITGVIDISKLIIFCRIDCNEF